MPKHAADLKANPRNPRTVTDKKLAMLKKALLKFGDLGCIVFNRRSGHLVGGHQRIKALPEGGTIRLTGEHKRPTKNGTVAEGYLDVDGASYAYREVEWDEATEKAANLAANKGAGEFDMPAVKEFVDELQQFDFDLSLTMFDDEELAAMATDLGELSEPPPESDEPPAPPSEPKAKPGDLYQLGRHKLLCGDSSNPQHVDLLMGQVKADMVYSDPPYGMRLDTDYSKLDAINNTPKWRDKYGIKNVKRGNHRPVHGDDQDYDPSFLLSYFNEVAEIFLWGADYYCQHLPKEGSWVVWDKRVTADGEAMGEFHGAHFELCWSKGKHQRQICRHLWMGAYKATREETVHPTQKPVAVAQWFFERWGKAGDVVVDLYAGSGSTLLACERTGRTCYTCEIDPGYVDVVIARWEKETGKAAMLVGPDHDKSAVHDVAVSRGTAGAGGTTNA